MRAFTPVLGAALALTSLGVARADELRDWLAKTDATERFDDEVVARRANGDFVARLLAVVEEAGTADVRSRAVVLLSACDDRVQDAAALRPLDATGAERIEMRAALFAALEKAAQPALADLGALDARRAREAIALLRDPLFDSRERAALAALAPALAHLANRDATVLVVELVRARDVTGGEARLRALDAIAASGTRFDLARVLAAAIDDPDARVAARALEDMPRLAGEPEHPDELDDPITTFANLALASGSSADRRAKAVEALGRTRSKAASPCIESALRGAVPIAEDRVRVAALVALGRTAGRPASDIAARLVELLGATAADTQDRAIDGLGELPAPVVESVLRPHLQEGASDDARLRAARAARALGLKALAPDLVALASSENATIGARLAAIRALEVVGGPSDAASVGAVLLGARSSPDAASLRRSAALALGADALRGPEARAKLQQALDDEAPIVRLAAIRSLGAQRDPSAARPLVALVARTQAPPRERAQAIRALDVLAANDERSARQVAESIEDDPASDVQLAGAEYLARAPRKVAIPTLLHLMDANDASVRERAHGSLLAMTDVALQPEVDPFGYDPTPAASRQERAEALARWREWWDIHQDR